MHKQLIESAAELIKKGSVAAFCGSGVSRESGVPVFRGREGLWEKYDPNLYVTEEGILSRLLHFPQDFRDFIVELYGALLQAKPGYSHYSLRELEIKRLLTGIITQNIDDLHFQAGSREVVEIHGNAYAFICRGCGVFNKRSRADWLNFVANISRISGRIDIIREVLRFAGKCPSCDRRLESSIVLFGQHLPEETVRKSYEILNKSGVLLCVGTSGVVYPAASFPAYAKQRGAKIVNVNPAASRLDDIADINCRMKAGEFFSALDEFL